MTVTDTITDEQRALFERARDWMWNQNASSWVSDAFGHWVIADVAPRGPVPDRLTDLWARWNFDDAPRQYRARHGARLSGSPPWTPGQPLPGSVH